MDESKEIREGNKLIAEFMGANFFTSPYGGEGYTFESTIVDMSKWKDIKDAQYHTSWDWLMPVVEKMNSMKYALSFDSYAGCEVYDYSKGFTSFITVDRDGLTLIECVYQSAIQFIQWLNTSSPHQSKTSK